MATISAAEKLELMAVQFDVLNSDVFSYINDLISDFPAVNMPMEELIDNVYRHVVTNELSYDELETTFDKRFEEEAKNNE